MTKTPASSRTLVLILAAVVVGWRLLAWATPSPYISIPEALRLPLAVMGLFFAACGLLAWWLGTGRTATPFLLYGLGAGVHWGGAVGGGGEGVELALLFVYVAASVLAEGAFLHLALVYPPALGLRRVGLLALYAPAALGGLLAALAGTLPRAALETALGLLLLVATLLSVAAGVVFLVRLVRAERGRRGDLMLVLTAILGATLLSLLGGEGLLPGEGEAYNLAHAAIPACLLWVLARRRPQAAGTGG